MRKGGSIIEGINTTRTIISSGVVVGLMIIVYAFYITLLPLFKTIQGGLQVFNERLKQQLRIAINEGYDSMFDARVGFTMADGGDSIEEKVSGDER